MPRDCAFISVLSPEARSVNEGCSSAGRALVSDHKGSPVRARSPLHTTSLSQVVLSGADLEGGTIGRILTGSDTIARGPIAENASLPSAGGCVKSRGEILLPNYLVPQGALYS